MNTRRDAAPLILIGTEDVDFYLLLDHILQVDGFACLLTATPEEITKACLEKAPAMILLDCRPRSFSSTEIFDRLKRETETASIPIIALVSRGAEVDHVQLLKAGIDDAFTRPIAPARLIARMRAVLRDEAHEAISEVTLHYADVEMNPTTHRVRRNGREIQLGPIEFKLLRHLIQMPEQVFSREDLIGAAWPDNVHVGPRTVDVHMSRLRRALKSAVDHDLIRTVREAGYALTAETKNPTDRN